MAKAYALYNPIAGNGQADEALTKLREAVSDELILLDMTAEDSYDRLFSEIGDDDYVIVCGGDGTLNRFANTIADKGLNNDIRYFPCGSGNDFARELGREKYAAPFSVKEYLNALPTVEIDGKTSLFINGIGYGIDGYCCEEGDKQRAVSDKPVNYTSIAIKGLLFHYKPTNATIIVDGVQHCFNKVWLAPTMKGRYYGGGMMTAPEQDRLAEDGETTLVLFHGKGRLATLIVFPSIFKGEHVSKKMVTILTGKEITVKFDSPRAVQVDGETILDVTEYTAKAAVPAKVEA